MDDNWRALNHPFQNYAESLVESMITQNTRVYNCG